MWSRWCARAKKQPIAPLRFQKQPIVPLRFLTSGQNYNRNQRKFLLNWIPASVLNWISSWAGVGAFLVTSATVYISIRNYQQEYRKSFEYSKEKVKKALFLPVPKPVYRLPQLERKELIKDVLARCNEKILLVEGASGTGKTTTARELLCSVSKSHEGRSRRGVLFYTIPDPVLDAKNFFDDIVSRIHAHIEHFKGIDVLREAFQESYEENEKKRVLFVIDNAQKLAENDKVFEQVMGNIRDLMEFGCCDIILIVSNGSILMKARSCSGLSSESRLDYMKWPHVNDEEMKAYLFKNRDKIFQNARVSDIQINEIVKLFDSSFTDLQALGTKKDIDAYMAARLMDRRDDIAGLENDKVRILKKIYAAKDHVVSRSELGGHPNVIIAEELVKLKFLARVERGYVFHDRLTLESMAKPPK
jgi:Cdc6-like AAA superfamily ATPase